MCLLALGAISLVGNLIGGAVERNRADTERNRATERVRQQTEARKKTLKAATDREVQAERDVANVLEGQTSISPEAAYARRISEQSSASAIEKALKSGVSSGEIMSRVAGLTGQAQQNTRAISAQEESRRRQAQVGAKQQRVRAAQAGTRGETAQFALEDSGEGKTLQQHQLINQASAQTQQSISNIAGDVMSLGAMMEFGGDMGFGGIGGGGGGGYFSAASKASRQAGRAGRRQSRANARYGNTGGDFSDVPAGIREQMGLGY